MYSMKELANRCGKSQQAIYKLIAKNPELSALVEEHSTRNGRFINYGAEVLNWLINHYQPGRISPDTEGTPVENQPSAEIPKHTPGELERLQTENDLLREQVKTLNNMLASATAEKQELIQQNGEILHILRETQNEVQRLLNPPPPPSKPTILNRLKAIFSKGV